MTDKKTQEAFAGGIYQFAGLMGHTVKSIVGATVMIFVKDGQGNTCAQLLTSLTLIGWDTESKAVALYFDLPDREMEWIIHSFEIDTMHSALVQNEEDDVVAVVTFI